MLRLPQKPSFETFIQTCTPLAQIAALEMEMSARVDQIAKALLTFTFVDDPLENLTRFLQADRDFLGIVLSLSNLSQEKFLRILTAERFAQADYGVEWSINKVHQKLAGEMGFAQRIASLFLDGRTSPLLVQNVAGFYLDQLGLPAHWQAIIQDEQVVKNVIRRKLAGAYADRKGDAIESIIRDELAQVERKYGVTHSKSQVVMVRKEVDHAIPSLTDPYVLIMTSYMETTGSGQTARANEQSEMYGEILANNRRYRTERAFVNIVDGAGWLARRSDLAKLYAGCDYILNLKTLEGLEAIICKHVPPTFFTVQPRPQFAE